MGGQVWLDGWAGMAGWVNRYGRVGGQVWQDGWAGMAGVLKETERKREGEW